jgi:tRNA pseudouridine13 synthase
MFRAVVLELTLGPAAYATMALREVTHEETSSWWQTSLTVKGEDQGYKDGAQGDGDDAGEEAEGQAAEGETGEGGEAGEEELAIANA